MPLTWNPLNRVGHTSTTCNVRGTLRIYTVVSADFRPLPRNRLASSAPSACHSETSAHTGRGNPSLKTADETLSPPEWERQRVYCTVNSHYNPYRTKLLKVKEIQKPSVFGGIFCILFAAVGKKYAAEGTIPSKSPVGDTKEKSIPSETIKNENFPTVDRFTPCCNGSRRGHGAGPPVPRPPASPTDAGNCAG